MKIFLPINLNYNDYQRKSNCLAFQANGTPLSLRYLVENRSNSIPKRVLDEAKRLLEIESIENLPSLLQIHKDLYAPLLKCKTLDDVKKIFPEFENVKEDISFIKNNHYKRLFEERTAGESFAVKMLQEYWANLKTLKEIAASYGMRNRASLDWPLKQISFPKFENQYKNILLASDNEGTKILAKRVTDYDAKNSSRREKIREANYAKWMASPEIRAAMSEFASKEGACYRKVLDKISSNRPLNPAEKRINKGFFKRFWQAYPHLKKQNPNDK